MKIDKPQKGNPHNLVVNQHIFPSKSIERFANKNGRVELKNMIANKVLFVKSDDKIFCARRVWDQRAESGYMKSIEDEFQKIIDRIINDPIKIVFTLSDKRWIDRFYALWALRFYYSKNPQKDENRFSKGSGWSKDEQEQLEKVGFMFINDNGDFLGRNFAGSMIQTQIGDILIGIKDSEWGVLSSKNLEFIVPDHPYDFLAIPLTPQLCLYSKSKNVVASDEQVNFINKKMMGSSIDFYFAKDLSKCTTIACTADRATAPFY